MIEVFSNLLGWLSTAVIAICCLASLLKVIWNLLLPYAMLREREKRSWSVFPLIEFVPLLVATLISWIAGKDGWMSPSVLFIYGGGLILASYLHFCGVSVFAGVFLGYGAKDSNPE